ncbi:hypothetical protein [Candidatus Nanohalovita haloferacivicina]|uniref:hypothetical protein n=1 Tax=Candidatus Nanohalovita haloferacivicina TaxID=2978046 RepID=UPI00325F9BDE|nr:hypothetical protein HBNXNv_0008 [Candidatus Nanohalobia archaeon BNXNv]
MSDDEEPGFFGKMMCWLHTPKTENSDWEHDKFHEKDDIWHHEHLFEGHWVEIQNKAEWYESPNIVSIYKDHKYIFNQNMELDKPSETFYYENVDSGEFESVMEVKEDLPSKHGKLKLTTNPATQSPPSGDNDFGLIEYWVKLEVKYSFPDGINWLPRIFAYPLNRFFKKWFVNRIGEEMIEYDIEYARERLTEYFDYIRKYHGEEPVQTKTRQEVYTPPTDGPFFQ